MTLPPFGPEPLGFDPEDHFDGFEVRLRGYDRHQVEDLVQRLLASRAAHRAADPAAAPLTAETARARRDEIDTVLRGYDRAQVRAVIDDLIAQLATDPRA